MTSKWHLHGNWELDEPWQLQHGQIYTLTQVNLMLRTAVESKECWPAVKPSVNPSVCPLLCYIFTSSAVILSCTSLLPLHSPYLLPIHLPLLITQMKHLSSSSLPQRASSTSQPGDGDNVSMASNVTAEDATMQEAFMGLVSRKSNLIPILNQK